MAPHCLRQNPNSWMSISSLISTYSTPSTRLLDPPHPQAFCFFVAYAVPRTLFTYLGFLFHILLAGLRLLILYFIPQIFTSPYLMLGTVPDKVDKDSFITELTFQREGTDNKQALNEKLSKVL